MGNRDRRRARVGKVGWVVALVLVVSVACGGTAMALSSGFFERAFGRKGREDSPQHMKTYEYVEKGEQLVEADPEFAQRLLGDAVTHVGAAVEAGGFVLTIEDVVIDDHDLGAATFRLACPHGTEPFLWARDADVDANRGVGYGNGAYDILPEEGSSEEQVADGVIYVGDYYSEVQLADDDRMEIGSLAGIVQSGEMISLWAERADEPCYLGDGTWSCETAYTTELDIDWDKATDDELVGTMYFCPSSGGKAPDGAVRFHLAAFRDGFVEANAAAEQYFLEHDGLDFAALSEIGLSGITSWDDLANRYLDSTMSEPVQPNLRVASVELVDGSGKACHLSPIGVAFDKPADFYSGEDWYAEHLVIAFADGGEYAVEDDRYRNYRASDSGMEVPWNDFSGVDGLYRVIFNRLVDPATVVSVTTNGAYSDETVTFSLTE